MAQISSKEWAEAHRAIGRCKKNIKQLEGILFKEESDMTMQVMRDLTQVCETLLRKLE
jgi:hypothetical protein